MRRRHGLPRTGGGTERKSETNIWLANRGGIRVGALLVLMALGAVYMAKSLAYGLGSFQTPGVGFFPLVIGGVWELLTLILLIQGGSARSSIPTGRETAEEGGNYRKIAWVLGGEILFIEASPIVGFVPAAVVLSIICLVGTDEKRISRVVIIGLLVAGMTDLVLSGLLGLPSSSVL